jgi:hypothetical protein
MITLPWKATDETSPKYTITIIVFYSVYARRIGAVITNILINLGRLMTRNFRYHNDFSWFRYQCFSFLLLSKALKFRAAGMGIERGLICKSRLKKIRLEKRTKSTATHISRRKHLAVPSVTSFQNSNFFAPSSLAFTQSTNSTIIFSTCIRGLAII